MHQNNIVDSESKFNVFYTDISEFPPHWHEEIEIIYVVDKILKVGINENIYTLNQRDIIIVSTGDVHYFLPQYKNNNRIIIQAKPSLFKEVSDLITGKQIISPVIKKNNLIHKKIEQKILDVEKEFKDKKPAYMISIKAMILEIITIIIREVEMETYLQEDQIKRLNSINKLEKVFDYIDNNYNNEISLDEISKVAHLSKYHFTRFFKQTLGMTFLQYLNNYRISKSMDLLVNSRGSITDIALKSGFSSIKTFNRVFKNVRGCTPTEYRKQ
ncbi:MAG: helix-turn-helix domain-containing protein [Clostridiaceae bacterium]